MNRVPITPRGRAEPRGLGDPVWVTALSVAFVAACALAPFAAKAQETVYIGGGNPSVTVDMGVLEELGPTPTVPDLLLPTVPQPAASVPLRFPSQPPTFPTTLSSDRPVVLVPPPQTDKPTQPAPAPQIAAPVAPLLPPTPPPSPEVTIVEEEVVIVEETIAVTAPATPAPPPPEPEVVAPQPPPPPEPQITAPAAPTMPVVTETPIPAPPTSQTAAVDPLAGTSDEAARLMFERDGMELSDAARAVIRDVAEQLNADETKRLQLMAYAGEADDDTSKARRLSLSRALAVRSELIALGVRSTRIDVRALGNKMDGGPADRVDLILADR